MRRTIQALVLFAVALTLPTAASAADPTGYFAWLQQQARQQAQRPILTPAPLPPQQSQARPAHPTTPAVQPLDQSRRNQVRQITRGTRNSRALMPVYVPRVRPAVRVILPVVPVRPR